MTLAELMSCTDIKELSRVINNRARDAKINGDKEFYCKTKRHTLTTYSKGVNSNGYVMEHGQVYKYDCIGYTLDHPTNTKSEVAHIPMNCVAEQFYSTTVLKVVGYNNLNKTKKHLVENNTTIISITTDRSCKPFAYTIVYADEIERINN